MRRFFRKFLIFCCFAHPTWADVPTLPINFSGRYDFALSGIPFGKLDITLKQNAKSYTASSNIEITGLAKLFVQHESHAKSYGNGRNFRYSKMTYETNYATRKKPKYVKMVAKNGVWHFEDVRPADNRQVRPAVSAVDKKSTYDPLFLALAIRAHLAQCLQKNCKNFSEKYYDGRRLTRIDFTFGNETSLHVGGKQYSAYRLTARRMPLAGFTQKELSKIGKNDPLLTLYFSHDTQLIPLLLEVPLAFGNATATLRMDHGDENSA